MKILEDLLSPVEVVSRRGDIHLPVRLVTNDSRNVIPNSVFVAIQGYKTDGSKYIKQALEKGATTIVCQKPPDPAITNVTWIQVENDRRAFSRITKAFYDNVPDHFYTVGVTGTNGKTTITTLVAAIYNRQYITAQIGTLGMNLKETQVKTSLTTPEPSDILKFMWEIHNQGCQYLVMEVSSVALQLARVEGIKFSQAIFTNFSGDHLDFHGTMEEYLQAKLILFKSLGIEDWAVINVDDDHAGRVMDILECNVITYGLSPEADIRPVDYTLNTSGIQAILVTPEGELEISSPLIGRINLLNIMAAVASAQVKKINKENIQAAIAVTPAIRGRLEFVYREKFSVLIDYAHTDQALESLLVSLAEITSKRIILVFGAGGGRDRSKRQRMGAVASKFADVVVVTSDNPRDEDPLAIIEDIRKGINPSFPHLVVEADRESAIRQAIQMAETGDVVAIAGKGHETYQIFKDKTIHFSDYEVVEKIVGGRGKNA